MEKDHSPQQPLRTRSAHVAVYANYFEVGHNAFEFLIDFGQFQPDSGAVSKLSRVVCGPVHAKLLAKLLWDAVLRFEAEHGVIADLSGSEFEAILNMPPDFELRAEQARTASPVPHPTKR
jgi:hypothetical protein